MSPKSPLITSTMATSGEGGYTTRHGQPYPLPYQVPITRTQEVPCPPHHTTSGKVAPPTNWASTLPLGLSRANTVGVASTPDANDQYVSMKRVTTNAISPPPAQHDRNGDQPTKGGGPEDPYVPMQSWSVKGEKARSISTSEGEGPPTQGTSPGAKGRRNRNKSAYSDSRGSLDDEKVDGAWQSQLPHRESRLPDENLWRGGADGDEGRGGGDEDDGRGKLPSSCSEADSAFLDTSHYRTPRSTSTSIPSSIPVAQDMPPNHDPPPQSLLDASNFDPTPNLPEPLVLSASPSPTKAPRVLSGLYLPGPTSSSMPGRGLGDSILPSPSYLAYLEIGGRYDSDDDLLMPKVKPPGSKSAGQATPGPQDTDQPQSIAQPHPPVPCRPRPAAQHQPKVQTSIAKPRSGLAEKISNGPPTMGPPTVAARKPPTVAAEKTPTITPTVAAGKTPTMAAGKPHEPMEVSAPVLSRSLDRTQPLTLDPGSHNDYQSLIPETLSSISDEYVRVDSRSHVRVAGNGNKGSGSGSAQRVNKSAGRRSSRQGGNSVRSRASSQMQDKDDILEEFLNDEEFIGCEIEICKFSLEQHDFDIRKAKEEVRVQILLGMLLPNIREEDCRKALVHCQQKTNRAAAWLLQKSEDISRRTL